MTSEAEVKTASFKNEKAHSMGLRSTHTFRVSGHTFWV